MDRQTVIASEQQLKEMLASLEPPKPGEECFACHRPVPKERSDSQAGPRREVLTLHIPKGEEGALEEMLIQLVDKFQEQWPREHAAMRASVGLEVVGGRSWKYHAVHFAVYACLMVAGLEPTTGEEEQTE